MKGYFTQEAIIVMTSRNFISVRIPVTKKPLTTLVKQFVSCGEGAGYAGGIMSAAMDGERVAENC
jgi:uncharacterized FAD-dependent dehydrogenase